MDRHNAGSRRAEEGAVQTSLTGHWQATAESYFGRVSRDRILDAVREGVSPAAAENLAKLKKQALAEAAAERLRGTPWLPPLLRTHGPTVMDVATPREA